jgi:hypothetical protein
MSKLGVGIGDEFPIDDGKPAGDSAQRGPEYDSDYEARRAEWHGQRDAWRDQRRQWRDQWREKKRAFREEMRAHTGDDFDHDGHWHGPYGYGRHRYVFKLLALAGAIVIAITIFSHIYILFGLLVLAGLFYAYHHRGYDHFDWSPSAHPAPRRPAQSPTSSPSSAPPAPPSDTPKA